MENKHDRYFKHAFSHHEDVADFVKVYLPNSILKKFDLLSLRQENTDFLPNSLKKARRADLLYSIKAKEGGGQVLLLLHLEHQSTHDRTMAIRVLEYQTAIMRAWLKRSKDERVPPIFTFVVYHGVEEWTSAKSVAGLFTNFRSQMLAFQMPFLINLSGLDKKELQRHGRANAAAMILSQRPKKDMCGILADVVPLLNGKDACCKEEGVQYMVSVDAGDPALFFKKLSKFDIETADKYSTMFEHAIKKESKRVAKEAFQQGVQQGVQQERKKILALGILTPEQVEEIKKL